MKLRTLLEGLAVLEIVGGVDVDVGGVQGDSRRVRKGDVFVALRGEKVDGHEFIGEAVGAGVSVVVCEEIVGTFPSLTQVRVADSRAALARLASRFHDNPSEGIKVIGITGTNGKTTTSYLIASILETAGLPTGVIGTIAYRIGNRELPAPNTTPPADELQGLLAQMVHAGMQALVMEVSSHALAQHRVDEVMWDGAVFTNLSQDHLDYHKTMESYFDAKKLLFRQLGCGSKKAMAILNLDDPRSEELQRVLQDGVRVVSFGRHPSADIRAEAVEQSVDGCHFILAAGGVQTAISTPLCGAHNVSNCLAAAATAMALGIDRSIIQKGIELVRNVPGRLERVEWPVGVGTFVVFVDYAHTDDALRNVLNTLRPLTKGRLITVFGCGGNRDTTKRPLMGRVAGELSDFSIVTTDNPRNEEPDEIVEQIVTGFGTRNNFSVVLDRREAIRTALAMAQDGDTVLLAGKGHERYQEARGTRTPFDDQKVAGELLESLLVGTKPGGEAWRN